MLTVLMTAALALCFCSKDKTVPSGMPAGPFLIKTDLADVPVAPNESRQILFALLDADGQPLASRVLQFQIVDLPSPARGATLSIDRALTDAQGQVSLQVIAGLATSFTLRVSSDNAPTIDVTVVVESAMHGSIEVVPQLVAEPALSATIAQIRLHFLPGARCAEVNRSAPTDTVFPVRTLVPGGTTTYSSISADQSHALVGQGLDAAGVRRVDGCIDLSGQSLLADGPSQVVLPLSPPAVSPIGSYTATTQLSFLDSPKPAVAIAQAWGQLVACGDADPGRLWLDCTVDALGPETADDPLDCIPSAADEAAFDGRLAARRGLPNSSSTTDRCRNRLDGAGRASLETQIAAMFATVPQVSADLKAIADDASKLFQTFKLNSEMTITGTTQPGRYQLDHQLDSLVLGRSSAPQPVDLWSLGLPSRRASFVPATANGTELDIDQHGFTLRLGSAARIAFTTASLGKRSYPTDISTFITTIFATASYHDRGTTYMGCAALGALVCPLVTAPDGCVMTACQNGLAGLGRNLDAVFGGLDGSELDFYLQGYAPMVERDGDGRADALGWVVPTANAAGVWSAKLTLGADQYNIAGLFAADRISPASPDAGASDAGP